MAATISDIAEKTGLSVSTVSRVLNHKSKAHRISPDTAELVLRTAKELNYKPNELARGLRLRKTNTVGLIIPDISNPFFAYLTRTIQRKIHNMGYSLVVCDTDESLEQEIEHTNVLTRRGLDGIIVMPVGLNYEHFSDLQKKGYPLVLLDRCFDEWDTSCVIVDNYRGAYDAVDYVIRCGHSRIAIIQGLPHTYTSTKRLEGYKDALNKHHIELDPTLIVGNDFRKENGYIETKFLLNLENPPTAIFATSDLITLGALEAIYEDKLRIPEDISLIAFDDIDFGPFLISPLTAVAQPREMMGEIAVKLLKEQIDKQARPKEPKRIVLKPELIVRGSVKVLAPSDNKSVELSDNNLA